METMTMNYDWAIDSKLWIHEAGKKIIRKRKYQSDRYYPKQTDMVFLERDIKARKHAFGIQIYDILSMNNASTSTSEIQKAFDECAREISELEAKVGKKREEMEAIDGGAGGANSGGAMNSTEAEFGAVQSP